MTVERKVNCDPNKTLVKRLIVKDGVIKTEKYEGYEKFYNSKRSYIQHC